MSVQLRIIIADDERPARSFLRTLLVRFDDVEIVAGNVATAEGARFLLISNPTRTSGAFYNSHQPRSDYHRLHIDSHDSPNVTGEASIPGLASPGWIAKMEAKYGRDSLFCRVRVRGEFPSGADDEVFGAELVRRGVTDPAMGT